jgi:hypothetical protein
MGGEAVTTIPGYVSLADYDYPQRDKKAAHSPQYKLLRQAIADGDVDGFQHSTSGRWLVNKEQAESLLQERQSQPERVASDKPRSDAIDRIADELEAIVEKLEKLDKAEIVGWARTEKWCDHDTLKAFVRKDYRLRGVAAYAASGLKASVLHENGGTVAVFHPHMLLVASRAGFWPTLLEKDAHGKWQQA